MRVSSMRAVAFAMLGPACSLPAPSGDSFHDEPEEDSAVTTTSGEDRIRELSCSGELPVYETGPYDVTIDWARLTADLWDEPVDPASFETVALLVTGKDVSAESVRDSMCDGTYEPTSDGGYVEAPAQDRTSIRVYELSFMGTHYNGSIPGSVLWLMWSSSRAPGMDIEMLVLLGVVDDGPATVEVQWPL